MQTTPATPNSNESIEALLRRCVTALEVIALAQRTRAMEKYLRQRTKARNQSAKPIQTPTEPAPVTNQEMIKIVRNYILDHQGQFTRIDYIDYEGDRALIVGEIQGVCAGKFERDHKGAWSLAVPVAAFKPAHLVARDVVTFCVLKARSIHRNCKAASMSSKSILPWASHTYVITSFYN